MNSSQIARIVAKVKPLAVLLLVTACGGADGTTWQDDGRGGAGDSQSAAGAAEVETGGKAPAGAAGGGAGAATAGRGGEPADSAGGGAGGKAEPAAGGSGGSVETGGKPSGGAAGSATGGGGQAAHAGAGGIGGAAGDPLEPKPLAGCDGYVKVFVPKGTCVWFQGTQSTQTEACDLQDPPEGKCSTVSAVTRDLSSIVSDGVTVSRLDLEQGACPKKCP